MKKIIGNIVVEDLKQNYDNFYNKCLSLSEIDVNMPTLIIGFRLAKKIIPDFSIFKRSYDNGKLFWTFTKQEKRSEFDKDIKEFYKYCIKYIINNIKYTNISIIDLTYTKSKKLINYINTNNKKWYYIDNNRFLFLYDIEKTQMMFGFSLSTIEFYGLDKEKIIKLLKCNKSNYEIKNFYSIPTNVRYIIGNDIPSKMVLLRYFI